ncbi:Cytochrome c551 peroxidase [Candidatus Terasakiella magnetica]|uniref:Cytochrome c551 peroxidase n=1 Tax=Candidatus Terasakiella magnetica TaxID=1867952 RepID=A0A1C3RHU2_9PROT|nr:cytochrome-c peroxidase [Candidatus Terasakiella magnetica]SCA56848.1 Cytochrome c551 peroxidase [Candidatus Terasakiella magnetica]
MRMDFSIILPQVRACLLGGVLASSLMVPMAHAKDDAIAKYENEPITPIPLTVDLDRDEVALGRDLFHDVRLSKDDTISCASCHPLENGGVDGLRFSFGINGQQGAINTPTVLNSGLFFAQFWNGRAPTLEEQIEGPTHDPKEMGSNWAEIISKLTQDGGYIKRFAKLYPEQGIARETIKSAIATFERSLLTPNSPFDRFLRGEEDAISAQAKEGYVQFKAYGCSSCHQGVAVGANMYEKLGVHKDYFGTRGNITKADFGRFNVTGIEEHKFEFKVPSLRNVAMTGPYFHDGSIETLHEAVTIMAQYQLGRTIKEQDVENIVAFLESLSGELKP